jgi:GT2 family glycosyltransferase
MLYFFRKVILSIKKKGIRTTLKKILTYPKHLSLLKTAITLPKSDKLAQKNTVFPKQMKISIITPLYNTPVKFLKEMLDSVIAQTYSNWELCLADGSDNDHESVMHICQNYALNDGRIKYNKLEENYGISGNSNKAIEMSSGDYIGILDHDDILHPSALYEVMNVICYEDADFIYTDEANFTNNHIITFRHYKPDYAIDTLCSYNYICHFLVFSKNILEKAGMFKVEFDGSQDFELVLRYIGVASKIFHIPKFLYFWRIHKNSVSFDINNKKYSIASGKDALKEHLQRNKFLVQVENAIEDTGVYRIIYELTEKPLVSIIIQNKDNNSQLKSCLSSITEKTTYKNYEIIIIDNKCVKDTTSELNNYCIQDTKGKQLIFLNNDIELITPNWIEEMLMYSQRNDVGAVGAKLYYPDNTVQHAGIILGLEGVAGYIYNGESRDFEGYMGRLKVVQNLSAVSAACMMIKKSVFEEVGCFSPEFHTLYNDVDLCLKIRNAGYLVVWTPFAEAYHHKSKTRGYPGTPKKQAEFDEEIAMFKTKWSKELAAGDPYYNCNFSLAKTDYSISKT